VAIPNSPAPLEEIATAFGLATKITSLVSNDSNQFVISFTLLVITVSKITVTKLSSLFSLSLFISCQPAFKHILEIIESSVFMEMT